MPTAPDVRRIAPLDRPLTPRLRARRWRTDLDLGWFHEGGHEGVEVAWVHDGSLDYRFGPGRVAQVQAGGSMILPPWVEHRNRFSKGIRAGSVWVASEVVMEIADATGTRLGDDPFSLPDASRLRALGELLNDEAAREDMGSCLAAEALAEAVVVEVLRGHPPTLGRRGSDPRIRRAVQQIRAEYREPLSAEVLAKTAGMSRFHFSRRFRAETGASPYQYLLNTRCERAAELLRAGTPVLEAALSVGFQDPKRFTGAFRRRFGCTPGAYRHR